MHTDFMAAYCAARSNDLLREAEAARMLASARQSGRPTGPTASSSRSWPRVLPDVPRLLLRRRRIKAGLVAAIDNRQVAVVADDAASVAEAA
jgi:hypothetical protein